MFDYLLGLIGSTKSIMIWMHAAHHVSKGTSFSGDHVNLFGEIYTEIADIYDDMVEKSIACCDDELIACPIVTSQLAANIISSFDSPANLHSDQIAAIGLDLVSDYLNIVTQVYRELDAKNMLSLGMDDFLASAAGKFEKFEYLLGQRVKKGY